MITDKMKENAHKIAFLIDVYPEHTVQDIIKLLEMPAIDINTGFWAAEALGLITEPDKETKIAATLKKPVKWEFGKTENDLEDALLFAFTRMAKQKTDLEEVQLSNWTAGYSAQDVLIALRRLRDTKQLASYDIQDDDNTYTFFTLYENRDKLWGRKNFKKDPLAGKKAVKPTSKPKK